MPRELIYKDEATIAILQTNSTFAYCIHNIKPVDAVPLDEYNKLVERYKKLLETAKILDTALREYQKKYGDVEDGE